MYGTQRYKQTHYHTATPGALIVMLYDGLVKFTASAEQAQRCGESQVALDAVGRALNILSYLQAVLDERDGGELVSQLDQTYALWSTALVRLNLDPDPESLAEIGGQMSELAEAWRKANQTLDTGARA
jgi:flagellar protein FliS